LFFQEFADIYRSEPEVPVFCSQVRLYRSGQLWLPEFAQLMPLVQPAPQQIQDKPNMQKYLV